MRLPIPIYKKSGEVYTEISPIKPKSKILAETKRVVDTGNVFAGMKTFISGCTEEIRGKDVIVSDSKEISNLISELPYRSAYYVSIQIALLHDAEDGIEGVYSCPRCFTDHISERTSDYDNRDFISSLDILYKEPDAQRTFKHTFTTPVKIFSTLDGEKSLVIEVESMEFHDPTLSDCISAYSKVGLTDELRFQFAVFVESLEKVNGQEVDIKFKNRYGHTIFENIEDVKKDLAPIKEEIEKYGLITKVGKTCLKCGKQWRANINPSNFFVSALQSQ